MLNRYKNIASTQDIRVMLQREAEEWSLAEYGQWFTETTWTRQQRKKMQAF